MDHKWEDLTLPISKGHGSGKTTTTPSGRGIAQSYNVGINACLHLLTPSCCGECFYYFIEMCAHVLRYCECV